MADWEALDPYQGGGLPPPPTRDQILGGTCVFQGLWVETAQWGRMPLFDPAIAWLDLKADRLACYDAKRAAGSDLVVLAATGQYHEPQDSSNWYNRMPGQDFVTTGRMDVFHDLIVEALTEGGMTGVEVWCGGDGTGFDPGGLTYGFSWLMAHFADAIFAPLADLNPYLVWFAGADGCIPGWDDDNQGHWTRTEDWFTHARPIIGPTGHLGAYLSSGYWCWTEANRYLTPAGREVDKIVQEFPSPMGPPTSPVPEDFCTQSNEVRAPFDQVWQPSNRTLGPAYHRPPEQPACDDNKTFGEQIPPNARGPVYRDAREYDTYEHVRNKVTPATTATRRAYLRSLGWPLVG